MPASISYLHIAVDELSIFSAPSAATQNTAQQQHCKNETLNFQQGTKLPTCRKTVL